MADRSIPPSHKRPPNTGLPNRNPRKSPLTRHVIDQHDAAVSEQQRRGDAIRRLRRP